MDGTPHSILDMHHISLDMLSLTYKLAIGFASVTHGGTMRTILAVSALFAFLCAPAAAQKCVTPENVIDTTVSITRSFAARDYDENDAITLRGTAWFTKKTEMVAVEHVVEAFGLSHDTWHEVTVVQQYPGSIWWNEVAVLVRIKRVLSDGVPEDLHVLELKEPLPWPIQLAEVRATPFVIGERALGIGYTGGTLTAAVGQYIDVPLRNSNQFARFELVRRTERDVLLSGASGGPIFDCTGRVMAVIARILPESKFGALPRSADGNAYLLGSVNVLAVATHHVSSELLE